jgi:hypothetical protein
MALSNTYKHLRVCMRADTGSDSVCEYSMQKTAVVSFAQSTATRKLQQIELMQSL